MIRCIYGNWNTKDFNKYQNSQKQNREWINYNCRTKKAVFMLDNHAQIISLFWDKRIERNLDTHLAFIELEKAYDDVPLHKLLELLRECGMNQKYVRAIYIIQKKS